MASIRNDYPTIMNGTTIPFFETKWQPVPQKIEKVNQSEGGRDIVQQIRAGKMNISISYVIADAVWVQFFEQLNELDSFTIRFYNPKINGYDDRIVRMTNYTPARRRKSEDLENILGVWEISFNLEEF